MPVTTTSAAVHIAPVVVKTFFEHGKRRARELKEGKEKDDAKDNIFYDEAFHIVKAFIELGTRNTVESLQTFTNTHVPAPPWAAVSPVLIPLSSCNRAADILIDWFGSDELKHVVGGERWWQVRGLDGVDGEWITEKDYLRPARDYRNKGNKKLNDSDLNILRMDHLETVMLYVHGGGYFWGSINTHRYQIIRYARKFKGRAFAVNYRKAPQYPWPCPIQDVLAAYLYLTQPPPGALHKPVPASRIVIAGDSAGGGLCITALTILRDLGLAMPAGAVLISPWVDLTHSFPSIIDNQNSDIIPPHGFLAKPSPLWPLNPLPKSGGRVVQSQSNIPPKPGHADVPEPSKSHVNDDDDAMVYDEKVETQREMLREGSKEDTSFSERGGSNSKQWRNNANVRHGDSDYDIDFWEPKPPKVLMNNSDSVPLELHDQIQLYAATEQLSHPLVSPVLQGSLGNLPPLYILAGDDELLRDEIIYLAHRAAHPNEYPTRSGVLRDGHRQKDNAKRFTTPTKVHLQVFDGMCHVLTVFTFTESAKYAYRSIAEFVKHVSHNDAKHLERNPFPELHRPLTEILAEPEPGEHERQFHLKERMTKNRPQYGERGYSSDPSDIELYRRNEAVVEDEVKRGQTDPLPKSRQASGETLDPAKYTTKDVPNVLMIRERVDIKGQSRSMEPPNEIKALQVRPGQVGIIKEGPTLRWLEGQQKWDVLFEYAAKKAMKHRAKMEAAASKMLEHALSQGLIHGEPNNLQRKSTDTSHNHVDRIQDERRWGPLDLDDERPPPSAIAKRRDTHEALALLKKSIYHTAPVTHTTVPKLRATDAIRAALDPRDDPNKAPQQSASEQQVHAHLIPVHGLRLWDKIIRYFGKETSKKAVKSTHQVGEALGALTSD